MPNLKDLKTRINSVSSTQKITSAMKMVAAAKLRRAQEAAESGRPYAARMRSVIASLAAKADKNSASPLLVGRENVKTQKACLAHLRRPSPRCKARAPRFGNMEIRPVLNCGGLWRAIIKSALRILWWVKG